jgi:hypothetical protein
VQSLESFTNALFVWFFFLWWQQQQEIKYVAKATASTATAGKTGNGRAGNCWFPFSKEIN